MLSARLWHYGEHPRSTRISCINDWIFLDEISQSSRILRTHCILQRRCKDTISASQIRCIYHFDFCDISKSLSLYCEPSGRFSEIIAVYLHWELVVTVNLCSCTWTGFIWNEGRFINRGKQLMVFHYSFIEWQEYLRSDLLVCLPQNSFKYLSVAYF
jgi:hypothetical protein